jgi:hypothetical protein
MSVEIMGTLLEPNVIVYVVVFPLVLFDIVALKVENVFMMFI